MNFPPCFSERIFSQRLILGVTESGSRGMPPPACPLSTSNCPIESIWRPKLADSASRRRRQNKTLTMAVWPTLARCPCDNRHVPEYSRFYTIILYPFTTSNCPSKRCPNLVNRRKWDSWIKFYGIQSRPHSHVVFVRIWRLWNTYIFSQFNYHLTLDHLDFTLKSIWWTKLAECIRWWRQHNKMLMTV